MYRVAVYVEAAEKGRFVYCARISQDKKSSLSHEGCILIHGGVSYLITLKENKEIFRFTSQRNLRTLPTILIPFEMERGPDSVQYFIYTRVRLFVDGDTNFHLSIKRQKETSQSGKIPGVSHWSKIQDAINKTF